MRTISIDSGYSIVERVFALREMRHLLDTLSMAALESQQGGRTACSTQPVVRELATDSRMLDIACAFVGATALSG